MGYDNIDCGVLSSADTKLNRLLVKMNSFKGTVLVSTEKLLMILLFKKVTYEKSWTFFFSLALFHFVSKFPLNLFTLCKFFAKIYLILYPCTNIAIVREDKIGEIIYYHLWPSAIYSESIKPLSLLHSRFRLSLKLILVKRKKKNL